MIEITMSNPGYETPKHIEFNGKLYDRHDKPPVKLLGFVADDLDIEGYRDNPVSLTREIRSKIGELQDANERLAEQGGDADKEVRRLKERLKGHVDYSIILQQMIEYTVTGKVPTESMCKKAPHHAEMIVDYIDANTPTPVEEPEHEWIYGAWRVDHLNPWIILRDGNWLCLCDRPIGEILNHYKEYGVSCGDPKRTPRDTTPIFGVRKLTAGEREKYRLSDKAYCAFVNGKPIRDLYGVCNWLTPEGAIERVLAKLKPAVTLDDLETITSEG